MAGILDPSFSAIVDTQGGVLNLTANGAIPNEPVPGAKSTYSVGSQGIIVPLTATNIFTISGSSTKKVLLTKVEITGTQTTPGQVLILLLKQLRPDTGGTSTNYTTGGLVINNDSNSQAPTATVLGYTVNPTLGFPSANIRSGQLFVPAAATVNAPSRIIWDFGNRPGQAVVLRGPNELAAINLNATTVTGGVFWVNFEWTEE